MIASVSFPDAYVLGPRVLMFSLTQRSTRSWKQRPALTTTLLLVGSFQWCVGAAGAASPEEGRSHSSRFKGKAKMPAAGTVFVKATSLSSLKTLHSSGHHFWAPLHFKALLYKWMHKQNKIFFTYWAGRLVTEPCKTADIKLSCLMKMATVNNLSQLSISQSICKKTVWNCVYRC